MTNMVFSELNKIIYRKSTYITLILSFIFVFLGVFVFELLDYKFVDYQGNTHKGFEAISLEKKDFNELQKKNLLPMKLTNSEINKTINNLKNSDVKHLKSTWIKKYLYLLNCTYQLSTSSEFKYLSALSEKGMLDFYKAKENLIHKFLNNNEFKLSQSEKNFWEEKSKQCYESYDYGYHSGWMEFLDKSGFFIFIILAICISVAPVYSNEYQSGMDSIILASKYGKTKNNIAKILSSFLYATVVITISIVLCLGVTLAIFGTEGWNLHIQILQSYIAYPYTFLQLTFITIGMIYIATFVMVAFTLLLSSCMKTSFPVLIVLLSVLILPIVFGTGIKLLYLLPCKVVISNIWYSYISFLILGKVFDIYGMAVLTYILLMILMIPLTINIFKKHQVK